MKNACKAMICAASAVMMAASVSAVPLTLTLSNPAGGGLVTIVDGGLGDGNALPGVITFIGPVGNWYLNVTTGVAGPSSLDLNSVDATLLNGAAAGTLTIDLQQTMEAHAYKNDVGGTATTGSVMFNTLFNGATITSQTFGPPAFSGSAAGAASGVGLVEIQAVLTPGNTDTVSFDDHLCVPDGGLTMALLGFGLVGLEGLRRKIRS